jgi:hypothetical protein
MSEDNTNSVNTSLDDTTKIEEHVEEHVTEKKNSIENSKPYRAINYDNYDILYAKHVRRLYEYVETDIKEEFTTFTEHLIDDNAISRHQLLDAIDTFKYKYKLLKNTDNYSNWMRFTDEAFNYRPYQPCIIS